MDTDVLLDLAAVMRTAYSAARYDRTIDYRESCEPPLMHDDAEWADQLLRMARRR